MTSSLLVIGQEVIHDIRPGIDRIVKKLSKEPIMHLGFPEGMGGKLATKNKFYKLFQKLSNRATDPELLALTDHRSKIIVAYSYLILHTRNHKDLKKIFLKYINDSTRVGVAGGCTGSSQQLNLFLLDILNPAYYDSRLPYLKQEEYDNYRKKLSASH